MSGARHPVAGAIEASGVVAVIRLPRAEQLHDVALALAEGGVRAVEVTMTVPGAAALIAGLAAALPDDIIVGAGTVVDAAAARQVIDAGARFVVGPVFRPEVIDVCRRNGVAVMAGCFSPTEILEAWDAGADVVKVFPAGVLGPSFLRDIRGPLPQVRLMPTGGVTLANAGEWIAAGAVAIGVGTALVDRELADARRFDEITRRARALAGAVAAARAAAASAVAR